MDCSDLEKFLFKNDFTEKLDQLDYSLLRKLPLFKYKTSYKKCHICNFTVKRRLFHDHMIKCQRKYFRKNHRNIKEKYFTCSLCNFKTSKRINLEIHVTKQHKCKNCTYKGKSLRLHIERFHTNQHGGRVSLDEIDNDSLNYALENFFNEVQALKGYVKCYRNSWSLKNPLTEYFTVLKPYAKIAINNSLEDLLTIKSQLSVNVKFRRFLYIDNESSREVFEHQTKPINSNMLIFVNSFSFQENYSKWIEKITETVQIFQVYGSGWTFHSVKGCELKIGKILPARVGCYVPLPDKIKKNKSILNVRSPGQTCFKWAVLASIYNSELKSLKVKNLTRYKKYIKFEKNFDFSCINYPTSYKEILKFEIQNEIAINIFYYDTEEGILPCFISSYNYSRFRTVDLLLVKGIYSEHFATILDIHKLLGKKNHHRRNLCYNCLQTFKSCEDQCILRIEACLGNCNLLNHIKNCKNFKFQKIKMPELDSDGEAPIITFKNIQNQLKCGFVIYADFECILEPNFSITTSSTSKLNKHIPSGFSYVVIDFKSEIKSYKVYRGLDAIDVFLLSINKVKNDIFKIYNTPLDMIISEKEQKSFENAKYCHICSFELLDDRVRDHCKLTGLYRGPAHNLCNINYHQKYKVPVIIHNFRGYDSHLIIKGFEKFGNKIEVIPTNSERYMSMTVDNLVFIDSLQFMNSSLDKIVKNLVEEKNDLVKLKYLYSIFKKQELVELFKRKGIFPYEYVTSWDKLKEKKLPEHKYFYSSLKNENISSEDYDHAQLVFKKFNCKSLGDYQDLYVLVDTLQLACAFESYRSNSLSYYKLDPVHYISAPGLAWDAALKMTNVVLEKITDVEIYEFLELGMRGGVSSIMKRHSKANNKYMKEYEGDPNSSDQKYIISLDFNNLYGKCLQESLPISGFRFLQPNEIKSFDLKKSFKNKMNMGFIFECDLSYPTKLHNLHNDLPLAPEKMCIGEEQLSEYQQILLENLELKYSSKQPKLIPHLGNRKNYIVHYKNLEFYLSHGMKLEKIHKILEFNESPWLKKYIDFNTSKRAQAKSLEEQDLLKLMNNAVFGKGMENVRKRQHVVLTNDERVALRLVSKPNFKTVDILSDNLCSIQMERRKVTLDKAIYTGFSVLELSKIEILKFHYDCIKKKYGNRAELLFTDTDSLTYEITTKDLYKDMLDDIDLYDTSNYPIDHFLYSDKNKKVVGKMKDETQGIPIYEFIGLAPKVYCMEIGQKRTEKKAAKGVPKFIQKNTTTFKNYQSCLFDQAKIYREFKTISSFKHDIYTCNLRRSALHGFDSKRYIRCDGVSTYAWGHANILESDHQEQDELMHL